jgi:bifunctional non-homologous end joining protein LigD
LWIEPIQPMEPVVREAPFDSPKHLFQVKWDGVRVLAYAGDGGIRLINRRLNERTEQYPELVSALSGLPDGTVIDGEVIALGKDGKPSFPQVMKRDLIRSKSKIQTAIAHLPVYYMAFDILRHAGKDITSEPLLQRQKILEQALEPGVTIQLVDSVPGEGIALFQAVEREGMEGIVAKEAESRYLPGRKSELWQKIKCWREETVWVCGWETDGPRIRSLLAGIFDDDGELRFAGNVSSGITQKQWSALSEYLEGTNPPERECAFPLTGRMPGVRWAKPEIKLRVRYLEWTEDLKLRNPSILAFLS